VGVKFWAVPGNHEGNSRFRGCKTCSAPVLRHSSRSSLWYPGFGLISRGEVSGLIPSSKKDRKQISRSAMRGVAVFLPQNRSRFTMPDGKTVEREWKVGDAQWTPAETHLPENLSDTPLDLMLIELKGK
jgi:hypothetical protein